MSTEILLMLITCLCLFTFGGVKMSVIIVTLITAWAWAADGNTQGNLLFYIWLVFVALAILDINQSKNLRENDEKTSEEEKQNNFDNWLAKYKQHVNNCNNEDSES